MSRSVRLFAAAILAVLMAASMVSLASAPLLGPIIVSMVTTNGDTTTLFHLTLSSGGSVIGTLDLAGGARNRFDATAGFTYILQETAPYGWALNSITCGILADVSTGGKVFAVGSLGVASYEPQSFTSTWTVNLADHSVTINLGADWVSCTFTNGPAPPVGGFVESINTASVLLPYLALFGAVAVVVVAVAPWKKREN
jgi:hypothetical protein